jgi:hypothetical protein
MSQDTSPAEGKNYNLDALALLQYAPIGQELHFEVANKDAISLCLPLG